MRARSIRFRLAAWNISFLTLLLVIGGIILYWFFARSLLHETDAALRTKLEQFSAAFVADKGRTKFGKSEERVDSSSGFCPAGVVLQAADNSGKIFLRSDNLGPYELSLPPSLRTASGRGKVVFETVASPDIYPMRTATSRVSWDNGYDYYLQAGICLKDTDAMLKKLVAVFLLGSVFILVSGTLVGMALVGQALKPVVALAQKAREITMERLDQRVPQVSTSDEIGMLSTTLNEMLSRLDRSIGQVKQFTADASHELKTPLTIIRGEADTTLGRPRSVEEYQDTLRSILEEVGRMSRIVDDLLTLSLLDAGERDFGAVRLDKVVEMVHEHAKALASTKDQSVVLERVEPATVWGHDLRLRQLLLNLVDNAVRYTNPGGHIRLSLHALGEFAEMAVVDDGMGIPRDALPRIFDRFFRVDEARSRETGGTGLGLSICKQIVESHHGTIDVESVLERGTRFVVSLPLIKERVS